mgnify:CR=1 FL=1|tara:strand:- start:155 stop:304 length:150 start_codon:yes stop_codon:yes gene_type:complete
MSRIFMQIVHVSAEGTKVHNLKKEDVNFEEKKIRFSEESQETKEGQDDE